VLFSTAETAEDTEVEKVDELTISWSTYNSKVIAQGDGCSKESGYTVTGHRSIGAHREIVVRKQGSKFARIHGIRRIVI
jgi:hypothetical protein